MNKRERYQTLVVLLHRLVFGGPPKHHRNPAPVTKTGSELVEHFCRRALAFHGSMVYTETAERSELFHRPPGMFRGAHADCSQFAASVYHWAGNKRVNDRDYTGTLWNKGTVLEHPEPACLCIFGAYPGQHAAIYLSDEEVVGFGWQGAPDSSTLAGLEDYFRQAGHPGVRFLKFV